MDKDGLLGPNWCSNTKDCGLGRICVTSKTWGKICVEAPINAKTPKEGE